MEGGLSEVELAAALHHLLHLAGCVAVLAAELTRKTLLEGGDTWWTSSRLPTSHLPRHGVNTVFYRWAPSYCQPSTSSMCLTCDRIHSYYHDEEESINPGGLRVWSLTTWRKTFFSALMSRWKYIIAMHWRLIEFQYGNIYWCTQFLEIWFFFCWCNAAQAQVVETLSSSFSLLARPRPICIMYKHIALILPKWGGFLE